MKLSICKFAYKGNIWALPQENLILLNANKKCTYQPTHLQSDQCLCNSLWKVKSGKFGHQVNSDTHLQTVEIQMRRLLMSRLIRIFTVYLVNLFFLPITEL